jgi:hypothetical protein
MPTWKPLVQFGEHRLATLTGPECHTHLVLVHQLAGGNLLVSVKGGRAFSVQPFWGAAGP